VRRQTLIADFAQLSPARIFNHAKIRSASAQNDIFQHRPRPSLNGLYRRRGLNLTRNLVSTAVGVDPIKIQREKHESPLL
jgi:hypothetical protein